jgi:hypothetical protein
VASGKGRGNFKIGGIMRGESLFIDKIIDQIKQDVEMDDTAAIEDLLVKVPVDLLHVYLSKASDE